MRPFSIRFTAVLPDGGELRATARHPSGDLIISGGVESDWWIGRIEEEGVIPFIRILQPSQSGDFAQVSDIAVQPDGSYSAILLDGDYLVWSTDDDLIDGVVLPRTYSIEPHPAYDVLHSVDGRIESLPLPR